MTSTVSKVLRFRSPFQSLPFSPIRRTLTHMRCRCRCLPSLISISVGADHPCCRKSHRSLCSFSLTGTILSIPSHIQSSRSQYFSSSNHLSCGFLSQPLLKACFKKASMSIRPPLIGSTAVTSHVMVTSGARNIQISKYSYTLLSKQLECNKAKLLEPAPINGLHNQKGLG